MFGILSVEIQYLCKVQYGLIEPMHRNKPNITYLLTQFVDRSYYPAWIYLLINGNADHIPSIFWLAATVLMGQHSMSIDREWARIDFNKPIP